MGSNQVHPADDKVIVEGLYSRGNIRHKEGRRIFMSQAKLLL